METSQCSPTRPWEGVPRLSLALREMSVLMLQPPGSGTSVRAAIQSSGTGRVSDSMTSPTVAPTSLLHLGELVDTQVCRACLAQQLLTRRFSGINNVLFQQCSLNALFFKILV